MSSSAAIESLPAIFVEANPRYIVTKLPFLDSVQMRNASPDPLNEPRGVFLIVRTKMPLHIYFNLMRVRVRARCRVFMPSSFSYNVAARKPLRRSRPKNTTFKISVGDAVRCMITSVMWCLQSARR